MILISYIWEQYIAVKQSLMIETISGIGVAVLIIIITGMLSSCFNAKLFATTILVAIAFISVGFALNKIPSVLYY